MFHSKSTFLALLVLASLGLCRSHSVNEQFVDTQPQTTCPEPSNELFEISNEDRELRDFVQMHIKSDFNQIETIEDGNRFFDRLRLLFRRNLISTAFARNEMRDLHNFLGLESTITLLRFDNRPFLNVNDDRLDTLQTYAAEHEVARKIFGKIIKKMIDVRNEAASKKARGSDGAGVAREPPSFWQNVWCKLSSSCSENSS